MIVYFIDDNNELNDTTFDNVANLESLERELDDSYPNGWSYDKADLEADDCCDATEMDIF